MSSCSSASAGRPRAKCRRVPASNTTRRPSGSVVLGSVAATEKKLRRGADIVRYHLDITGSFRRPAQGSTALIKEAVIGGPFELCLSYTLERRTAELSSLVAPATYFALALIIGSQAAARAARAPPPETASTTTSAGQPGMAARG